MIIITKTVSFNTKAYVDSDFLRAGWEFVIEKKRGAKSWNLIQSFIK